MLGALACCHALPADQRRVAGRAWISAECDCGCVCAARRNAAHPRRSFPCAAAASVRALSVQTPPPFEFSGRTSASPAAWIDPLGAVWMGPRGRTAFSPATLRRCTPTLLAATLILLISSPLHAVATAATVAAVSTSTAAAQSAPAAVPVVPSAAAVAAASASELDPDEFDTAHWSDPEADSTAAPIPTYLASVASDEAFSSDSPASEVLQSGFLSAAMSMLSNLMAAPSARKGGRHSAAGALDGLLFSNNWPMLAAGAVLAVGAAALIWACLSPSSPCGRGSAKKRTTRQRPPHLQPLLVELRNNKVGRVQGLDWASKNLKTDADGDEAHEFLGPF